MGPGQVTNQLALVLIGLLLAGWTVAAAAVIVFNRDRLQRAEASRRSAMRLARMVEESPAVPLLVRSDGRIEAPQRLADWLGLDAVPSFLTELDTGEAGLDPDDLAALTEAVRRTQKSAAPFRLVATPRGAQRALALRGHLADPQVSPGGAALVWVFEANDAEGFSDALRRQAEREAAQPSAMALLVEALPLPVWIRGPEGDLRFVNAAYVDAVGAADADDVLGRDIELVEPVDGIAAKDIGTQAAARNVLLERTVTTTVKAQRRALRVTDLPLGDLGSAGCAIDIEVAEEATRELRAFRAAQLEVLDDVSTGIARFDGKHQLTFANASFQRLFALDPLLVASMPSFEALLDAAYAAGRTPVLRDFPDWRREKSGWFSAAAPLDEAWPLANGKHLRIVARPQPDGGLVLVAEDRTEQLRLSAIRDTLLRTRTATLDSLFESVALFAPDGRMELWNRRFPGDWGLESDFLDTHPHIQGLARKIAPRLKHPKEADAVAEVVRAATLDRRESSGRVQLADGRTLAYAGVPLPDGNGLLSVLDMTDTQKAEEALRARNAALQEASDVRTRFLTELGQELRQPVAVIGGFAERMRDGLGGDLDEIGQTYIKAILTSVDSMEEYIRQLLAVAGPDKGAAPKPREHVNLFEFARELALARTQPVEDGDLTLDLRGSAAVGRVFGERARLGAALGTLLDNAIAATPPGGRILFELSRQKGVPDAPARIVISDNGPGVDRATAERLLAASTPPAAGTADAASGYAGLPLARAQIEALGGRLAFHSEPGAGSAIIIELQ
jgi:signal transduction histidine kinase